MLVTSPPKLAPTTARVLIVEDESLVALDLEERLSRLGYEVAGAVDNGKDAISFARTLQLDVILMDIHIRGETDGVETAKTLRGIVNVPIIFLTAHADEATLQRAGLTEPFGYVLKPFDERELHATIQMSRYRYKAEGRLRKMERWLATSLGSIGDGVIATDIQGRITFINAMAEAVSGWRRGEAIGRQLAEVFAVNTDNGPIDTTGLLFRAMSEGVTITLGEGHFLRTHEGKLVPLNDSLSPIRDDNGVITGCIVVFRDNTANVEAARERRALELKMQEAQRLESLGVLASGIAHDFNNLLVAVTCNASMGRTMIPADSPLMPRLQEIEDAANRAALLCKQMLAYAGQGQVKLENLELSAFTRDATQLLHVAIHKNMVSLVMDLADNLPHVRVDRSQLQQVIMNLVVNGAEAMADVEGRLTVRTSLFQANREFLSTCRVGADLNEGKYASLVVSDTGLGMAPDVLERIFDPFFTTKFTGRGLGLAATCGIVRSHGGALAVESVPGKGTTFTVLFPTVEEETKAATPATPNLDWRGSGRVLIVDDELSIRIVGGALLRHLGFEVDTAEDGVQAVEKVNAADSDYCLILLDLTMPRLDGHGAFQAIRAVHPTLPVLLMSGYSAQQAASLIELGGSVAFVGKPFTFSDLVTQIPALLAHSHVPSGQHV